MDKGNLKWKVTWPNKYIIYAVGENIIGAAKIQNNLVLSMSNNLF